MSSLRLFVATLLVAIVGSITPTAAMAADGSEVVSAVPYDICQHLPWWPGCPH